MSAKHQHYYPCKDLISPEERKQLNELARTVMSESSQKDVIEQKSDYTSLYNIQKVIDNWREQNNLPKDNGEYTKNNIPKWVGKSNPDFLGINEPIVTKLFGESNSNIIWNIAKRYGGSGWRLMISYNDKGQLPIHHDPKIGPQSNLNLPIYPDYAFYRPTNFHNSYDRNDIAYQVDYKVLRSPCLINMSKLHSAGDFFEPTNEHYNGQSVSVQIMFLGKYQDTLKRFQSNGWLSTTPF